MSQSRPLARLAPALTLFIPMLVVGACTEAPAATPEARDVPEYSIDQFMGTTTFRGASFSADNSRVLVSSDATGIFNAYAVPMEGGAPEPLTHSEDDAILAVSFFPEDDRFLYSADQGGNELSHLYVRETDGTVVDLTPGDGHQAQFNGWNNDRSAFFVATNERDNRYFDVYLYHVTDGYSREMIFENTEGYYPGAVSGDSRWIGLMKPRTTNDNNLYLYDRSSGETLHITPHEGDVSSGISDFSPESTHLLYTTNEGGEFSRLWKYDLASGAKESVVESDWGVMYGGYSESGAFLVVGINNDARTELRIYDPETMTPVELPEIANADITGVGFSRDESLMAFYANSSRNPSDLYVQATDGSAPRQLTESLNTEIAPTDLVDGEVVRFASYDGVEIPGILYKPIEASPENKVPALVWVHGGPGGQSRMGYSPLIQYLVNHGYAVYAINNRGSSGYGKTFYAMDDKRHGEADLGDVVASKTMLAETGWVNEEQIGIIGGSYGGYMVLAALAFEPEAFDVGVDIFGVANWVRTLESIPPWWEAQREALYSELGDPTTDLERLTRISPLFHAGNVVKPLIVLQGANDPRVLQVESDEMVEAVRQNGVPVEYMVFPDEGHGFRNKDNQISGYRAVLTFLDTYLKRDASAPVA